MIHDELTMIPGPTPVHPRILAALGRPTVSHQDPRFVDTFRDSLAALRQLARSESAQPFIVSGSGTLAMEMAVVNLLGPGDELLVMSHGYFGDRWAELAGAFGVRAERMQAEWGQVIPPAQLAERLAERSFRAVAITHVDTSTGAAAPVAEYCRLLAGRQELVLLDGVCATAGMDERFDDWGIDVLLTGAQKALGAPPGLALLLLSSRALARRRALKTLPAYYADLLRWLPVMEDPARYFSTSPVNAVMALDAALRLVLEEGLEQRFRRHERIAATFRAGLAACGFALVTASDCLAPTLSVARYPPAVEDRAFRAALAQRGIVVAGALGALAGRAFRLGHMGNIGFGEVAVVLQAMEDSLAQLGGGPRPGATLAAAVARWSGV